MLGRVVIGSEAFCEEHCIEDKSLIRCVGLAHKHRLMC